jgi:carbon-monoxide dehydrogenase medium subunit
LIPGAIDYHRPATLADAAALLGRLGESARVLAGGHSLIPMMKLRMATPEHLIDLRGLAELRHVEDRGDHVSIGAMTTQAELIADAMLAERLPILREAALQIADPQVRYVGTVGGNVANGDPGNDMPGLMQCLDATFELVGPGGARTVKARAFYHGLYDTARAEDEIMARIAIPVPPGRTGYAYEKQKRKIGDYATAACAVTVRMTGGAVAEAAVAMTNLADRPVFAEAAGRALLGAPDKARVEAAVAAALAAIDPAADNRGPVEFKRHVAGVMLRRAIDRALSRA